METDDRAPAMSGRSGRPTMRDVAARVGVSQALVSLVFRNAPGASPETRDRVLRAAAEIGYRPDTAARVLRRTRSRHIGVLFALRQPWNVDLVEALYPAAERHGYHLVLGALGGWRDEKEAVEELLAYRSEAMVLLGTVGEAAQLAAMAERMPVVDISRRGAEDGVDVVRVADEPGAALAVDHLVGLGHREIVHVDGGDRPGSAYRATGYRDAMRRHGLGAHVRMLPGDHAEESGAAAARDLLAGPRLPTAVFASNDRCASGVIGALRQAGVGVPADVSVVGFDDSGVAHLSFVDLTTVRQDVTTIADLAVRLVVERLDEGRTTPREVVLDPELVVRGTTAAPRAG